jgi:hypothetical protein
MPASLISTSELDKGATPCVALCLRDGGSSVGTRSAAPGQAMTLIENRSLRHLICSKIDQFGPQRSYHEAGFDRFSSKSVAGLIDFRTVGSDSGPAPINEVKSV